MDEALKVEIRYWEFMILDDWLGLVMEHCSEQFPTLKIL